MIFEFEAGIPQCTHLGPEDQVRNAGVKERRAEAGCGDLISSEHIREAQAGIGQELALSFLGI